MSKNRKSAKPVGMTNRDIVMQEFVNRKKLTDLELHALLPSINANSIRPARLQLLREGKIIKTKAKKQGYTVYRLKEPYHNQNKKTENVKSKSQLLLVDELIKAFGKMNDILNDILKDVTKNCS